MRNQCTAYDEMDGFPVAYSEFWDGRCSSMRM